MTTIEDKYLSALQALLPPGTAWTRAEDAELTALLRGLAIEAARVELRGLDLLEEFDPRTTTELIDDWERALLTGSECSSPTTLADRRARVHQRLLGYGDPNLAFWREQIETLGFTFGSIVTYRPMSAGFAAGDYVIGGYWAQGWAALVTGRTDELNALLQCTLSGLTPIHTTVVVSSQPYYGSWIQEVPDGAPFIGVFFVGKPIWASTTGAFAGFLAAGQSGEIQTSNLAAKIWTTQTPAASYTNRFRGGDTWFSAGANSQLLVGELGEIQRSSNLGVTWAHEAAAGGFVGTFFACAGYAFENVAVGGSGEIQYWTGAWVQHSAAGSYSDSFRAAAVGIADFGYGSNSATFVIAGTSGEIQVYDLLGTGAGVWVHVDPDEGFTGTWYSCTYANGYFWLVGDDGEIQQSVDGFSWRRIPNALTTSILAVSGDRIDSFTFGVPDDPTKLGGVIFADQDQDIYSRRQVGARMEISALDFISGSLTIYDVAVGGDIVLAVSQSGGLLTAPRQGT